MKPTITVETKVNAPIAKAWSHWTEPHHITKWNHASDDWHSPYASNELRPGGNFTYRMEAKNGSVGFDFAGTYSDVVPHKLISYMMGDGRKATVTFNANGNETHVSETFEAENENSLELQKTGWQAILDNFKKYTEAST